MNKKNRASILLFTLLILSVITFFTQQFVRTVFIGYSFTKTIIAKQKARMLALGGINLAISKLMEQPIKNNKVKKDKETDEIKFKRFLKRILPNLNKWQVYDLNKKFDDFDGQIKICITCENGKINLNKAFDFEKRKFKQEYELLFKNLNIKGKLKGSELLKNLTEFFKKRKKGLDDIFELTAVKGLDKIPIFYEPPKIKSDKRKLEQNKDFYLQDIFTTWNQNYNINLLFLSDSLLGLFGLRRPLANDAEKLKAKFNILINSFKTDWSKSWKNNWLALRPIYGGLPKNFEKFEKILVKENVPQFYSVLSYGKVDNVEQRLLAIIREKKENIVEKNIKKTENKMKNSGERRTEKFKKTYNIVRLYWLK